MGDAVYVELCDAGSSLKRATNAAAFGHRTQHIGARRATGILRERHNTSKRCFDALCKLEQKFELFQVSSNFVERSFSGRLEQSSNKFELSFDANGLQIVDRSACSSHGRPCPHQSRLAPFEQRLPTFAGEAPPTPYRRDLS